MKIFDGSIAEQRTNILTLAFRGALEKEFLNRYFQKSLSVVRASLVIAVFIYGVFGFLDAAIVPEFKHSFLLIRFAIVIPYFALLYLLSFTRIFQKFMQLLVGFGELLAGLGIIWMILIGAEAVKTTYYTGLILVFFYGYTFFRLRFVWATAVGWMIVAVYEIAAIWFNNTSMEILITNNFFFLGGNIIGMIVCYSLEYYARKDFISERLLEAEKKKIDEANESLERNVQQRTSELVAANEKLKQEILERKRAQDLLFESDQKYRTLFEESQDAVFISSTDGKILELNPAGVKLFGYNSLAEIINIDIEKNLYFNSSDRQEYRRLLEKDGQVTDFELVLRRKDKQKIVVRETSSAIKDEAGRIVAYHGIIRDVTEHMKVQQQLFQVQKMESIGLLAGGIAHDFNNILTAINGYAEMLMLKMDETNPLYKSVQHIQKGGERANNLTRQLLAFSRKQVYQLKLLDINALVVNLDRMVRRLIGEDIQIEIKLMPELHSIKADPGQIEQIIVNLAINARDAINQKLNNTQDKQITIRTDNIYLDQEFVKAHAGSNVGHHILLSLSDNGVGMDESTIEKIFEPFFTTKELGKGTGLGLSTVYGIVKQNKGYVQVLSEPDKGATFQIFWPSEGQKKSIDVEPEKIGELIGGRETILYVEDDIEVRRFTSEALESLGYTIIEAQNGTEALSILGNRSKKISLLFTDLVMPEMGGKELSEIVTKIDPKLKILFTSGYSDDHVIKQGILQNKGNFIQKPYTFRDISIEIRRILDD